MRGATVEPSKGQVPAAITLTPATGTLLDFDVRLTYHGGAVVGPRGEAITPGTPYTFGYSRFFAPIDWRVRYYTFDESARPVGEPARPIV